MTKRPIISLIAESQITIAPVRLETFKDPVYENPNQVPIPLRHTLRIAHDSGLTSHQLAEIFELPADWIEMFVTPQGKPN